MSETNGREKRLSHTEPQRTQRKAKDTIFIIKKLCELCLARYMYFLFYLTGLCSSEAGVRKDYFTRKRGSGEGKKRENGEGEKVEN